MCSYEPILANNQMILTGILFRKLSELNPFFISPDSLFTFNATNIFVGRIFIINYQIIINETHPYIFYCLFIFSLYAFAGTGQIRQQQV